MCVEKLLKQLRGWRSLTENCFCFHNMNAAVAFENYLLDKGKAASITTCRKEYKVYFRNSELEDLT